MENNKKIVNYILFFLIFIFFTIFSLFLLLSQNKKKDNSRSLINNSPTNFPITPPSFNKKTFVSPSLSPSISPFEVKQFTGVKEEPIDPQLIKKSTQTLNLIKKTPVILDNLKINYDFKSENFVVSPQSGTFAFTQEEREKIYQWFEKNYPDIPKDKIIFSSTPYVSPTPIPRPSTVLPIYLSPAPTSTSSAENEMEKSFKVLVEFLKTISDIATISNQSVSSADNGNQNANNPTQILPPVNYQPPKTQYPYIYYPQCGGPFDNYLLPGEKNPRTEQPCNICYAGCGPTTVAMIIASYKDKTIDPRQIVNEYGPAVGCDGSGYTTAQQVLRKYNIKVGEPFLSNNQGVRADEVASIFKGYINTGKTIFVLANFSAGGHYFWVVDVDDNNNIWAFDPYYGRSQIPYNQNSRYPYPLYRVAFTVSP